MSKQGEKEHTAPATDDDLLTFSDSDSDTLAPLTTPESRQLESAKNKIEILQKQGELDRQQQQDAFKKFCDQYKVELIKLANLDAKLEGEGKEKGETITLTPDEQALQSYIKPRFEEIKKKKEKFERELESSLEKAEEAYQAKTEEIKTQRRARYLAQKAQRKARYLQKKAQQEKGKKKPPPGTQTKKSPWDALTTPILNPYTNNSIPHSAEERHQRQLQVTHDVKLGVVDGEVESLTDELKSLERLLFAYNSNKPQLPTQKFLTDYWWYRKCQITNEIRIVRDRLDRRRLVQQGERPFLDEQSETEISDEGYSEVSSEGEYTKRFTHRQKVRRSVRRIKRPTQEDYSTDIPSESDSEIDSTEDRLPRDIWKPKLDRKGFGFRRRKRKTVPTKPTEPTLPGSPVRPVNPPKPTSPPKSQTPTASPAESSSETDLGLDLSSSESDSDMERSKWSMRDLPKFYGDRVRGELASSHIMEFEDFLTGVGVKHDDTRYDTRVLFVNSLKGKARNWFHTTFGPITDDALGDITWDKIKREFLIHFNPVGSTREQQIKAWKEMKWDPTTESLDDFSFRFTQLGTDLGYTEEQQLESFILCVPPQMYIYVVDSTNLQQALIKLKKCIALSGLAPVNPVVTPKTEETKPAIPFMTAKSVNFSSDVDRNDRLNSKIVKAVNDSVDDIRRDLRKDLDRVAQALDSFQRNNKGGRSRDRDRNSRGRNYSRDSSRDSGQSRSGSRDRWRGNSRDRGRQRSGSRDRGRNGNRRGNGFKGRSGSGVRYVCAFCKKKGHTINRCWELQDLLKAEGGKIVQNRERGREETDGETDGEGDDSKSDSTRYRNETANYARMTDQVFTLLNKLAIPHSDSTN